MKYLDDMKKFLCLNKDAEFNLDEEFQKSEQYFQELAKKNEELQAIKRPIYHFILNRIYFL